MTEDVCYGGNHSVDGVHMLELLPSILLTGSEGIGKTTIVETVARRLYVHVQQVVHNNNNNVFIYANS